MDAIVCSYCPESEINETVENETDGWLKTEFGYMCPECRFVRGETAPGASEIGINAFGTKTENE